MTDIVEVSSDSSDDTIILSPKSNFCSEQNEIEDFDVQALVNKYITENNLATRIENDPKTTNDAHSDDGLGAPCNKRVKTAFDASISFSGSSSSQDDNLDDEAALRLLHEKYKQPAQEGHQEKQGTKENIQLLSTKQLKKQEKELLKQQKTKEREQKKKELLQEKCIKGALAAANKNAKPTECMRFVTVRIDNEIAHADFGNEVINALQGADVQYKIESQICPYTITWSRKVQSHSLSDDGKLVLMSEEKDANEVLLILNCREFVDHINNNTLCGYIQSLQSALFNKKITLVIYGLQSYIRYLKKQHNRKMREEIVEPNEGRGSQNSFFKDFPKVTKKMIEYGLTELQLFCSCSHRLIETALDLGLLVAQFTKAVAEIPFKLQRYEKFQQTDWFVSGDNRDCVKVDKNGHGLNRLWNQMLTTFPLARLETAEAISANFPTVSSLMKAYDDCDSAKEAELLLQEIPVRRAAGPLSSSRKIGPELSKKIYNFFTSTDGEILL